MNTHLDPTHLDLTRLDPTRGSSADPDSPAAQALLARVLSTPRTAQQTPAHAATMTRATATATAMAMAAGRRKRPGRRWVLLAGAAAVTAAGLATGQVLTGAGTPAAFASWTPEPTALTAQQAASATSDCLTMTGTANTSTPGEPVADVTETRGNYLSTMVVTSQGIATCLTSAPGHLDPNLGASGGVGSWTQDSGLAEPARGGTTVLWGAGVSMGTQTYTTAYGRTGADVTAVVLTDGDGRRVTATVQDGWFSAWWPAAPTDSLTVATTLADGSTTERTLKLGEH